METPQQPEESREETPVPASLPPVEGRDDIGRESEEWGASIVTGEPAIISREPAEGRDDVAEDIEQERRQSYSSAKEAKDRIDTR